MSNALVNGLAGAGGGIIAQIITYPLQTVNTRQQTERVARKGVLQSLEATSSTAEPPKPSSGLLLQIIQLIKTEGWGGLYSGLKPSLLGTAASQAADQDWLVARYCHILLLWLTISAHLEGPFFAAQGIYYYFYQVFRNRAEAIAVARKKKGLGDGNLGMFSWLVVAAVAGCLNVLLTNPIWVLVTRMQTHTQAKKKIMEGKRAAILRDASESSLIDLTTVQDKLAKLESMKPHPYGTLHAVQEVYREAGITGFWKGIIPTLIMVCNPSIQFMIYESSLKHLKAKRAYSKRGLKNVTALEVFLLGALAKLGATVSTYPLLVVKSRLQAKQEIGGSNALRYTGTLDAIIKMIHYEGLPGFYKGMSTKIVQSVFAASVLFMVKEELVKGYLILANESRKFLPNVNK